MRQKVKIAIMDINGNLVWGKILDESETRRGINMIDWHGLNNNGKQAANGIYLLRITAGQTTVIKKIAVVR